MDQKVHLNTYSLDLRKIGENKEITPHQQISSSHLKANVGKLSVTAAAGKSAWGCPCDPRSHRNSASEGSG